MQPRLYTVLMSNRPPLTPAVLQSNISSDDIFNSVRLADDDDYIFEPFYDEAYAQLIPHAEINWDDTFPTPEWLDHIDYKDLTVSGPKDKVCYIYYVACSVTGLIKIGRSQRVANRVSSMNTGSAMPVIYLCNHIGGEIYEQMLHNLFAPIRHHKEWYWPHRRLLHWINYEVDGLARDQMM